MSFKPVASSDPATKLHTEFLPSTCLIQHKLLPFVSGFRNSAAMDLNKNINVASLKKPGGSVSISCFPKIIDNPEILEVLVECWYEDVWLNLKDVKSKTNIELLVGKANEYIRRLYPVLFSDDFAYCQHHPSDLTTIDPRIKEKRRKLLLSALRFNNNNAKQRET